MAFLPAALKRYRRAPAPGSEIERFRLGDHPLPVMARELFAETDGLFIPEINTHLLPLARAADYGRRIQDHPLGRVFGLLPITDSNDSNPYCLVLGNRLNGAMLLLGHDGDLRVSHASLADFLAAVAALMESGGRLIDGLPATDVVDARIRVRPKTPDRASRSAGAAAARRDDDAMLRRRIAEEEQRRGCGPAARLRRREGFMDAL